MRNKNRRWLFTWTLCLSLLKLLECEAVEHVDGGSTVYNKNGTSAKETRGLFAPRMDYEQWKPIGRGDPLKNDPTYDYVPPVLETVRYWRDTPMRKQDQTPPSQTSKKEILILGVSSKKPSTGASIPESNRREYFDYLKYVKEPQYNYQRQRPHNNMFTSSYFTPSLFLSKLTERPMMSKDESIPYTMLVPPPMPSKQSPNTYSTYSTAATRQPSATGVTIDQANLIFQSSSSVLNDWDSTSVDSSNIVTWKTSVSPEPIMSNIIDNRHELKPETYIKIDYSEPINITHTKEELSEEQISSPSIMHKGHVADGVMDLANTYVNIGKIQAQMDSSSGIGISGISVKPPNLAEMPPIVIKSPTQLMEPMMVGPMFTPKKQISMLDTMETMQPPPMSINPRPSYGSLHSLLQKEATKSASMSTLYVTTTTSTTPTPTTTTTSSLTTDPLFKHYKQPMEPIRGPMYLIIQGHSKVKTYGPAKQIHGISVQEINEIPSSDDARQYAVKHLHNYERNDDRKRSGRSSNLQTLSHVVQTGLGAIDFADVSADRRNDDFRETELKAGYKVSSRTENSSEKYYKGIVEAGDLARKLRNNSPA